MNKLLVLCARDILSPQQTAEIRRILLNEKFDWNRLICESGKEAVTLFLYHHLKHFSDLVPATALSRLKKLYIRNSARNLSLYEKTKNLFREMDKREVQAVPIKGFRLAMDLYSDIGLRIFVDLDLVVAHSERKRVVDILEDLGYMKEKRDNTEDRSREDERFYWTYRPIYVKDNVWVELHTSIPGLHYPLDTRHSLWKGCGRIEKEGVSFWRLPFEHELCLLCLHVQEHSYSRLDWMTDIAEIVTRIPLDWEKVWGFCDHEKIHSSVFYALHLVNSFWPGNVPFRMLSGFDVTWWEKKATFFLWPEEQVRLRTLKHILPMHLPTLFPILRKKEYLSFFKVTFRLFFPPRHWVAYYYGLPKNSLKMVFHYIWRIFYPILFLGRKTLKNG
jgi:hypothetical protein